MVDSSKWEVIEAGLKCAPGEGRGELHLHEGGRGGLPGRRAGRAARHGAAVVVMAFDEEGQAATVERRVEVCGRAYRTSWWTRWASPPRTSSSTPTCSRWPRASRSTTATPWTSSRPRSASRRAAPGALVSGGISNLSFSFRGSPEVREAMHAAFLYHAIKAGLDMGIVNAGALPVYDEIPPDLLEAVEDVLFARAPRRHRAPHPHGRGAPGHRSAARRRTWRGGRSRCASGIVHALVQGIDAFVEEDAEAARARAPPGPWRSSRGPSWTA